MGRCIRGTEILGDRAGDTSQWADAGGGKAPGVPQVPAADFYGICSPVGEEELMGAVLLQGNASKGREASSSLESTGIQMDPDYVQVLEGADRLQ